MTNWRTFLNASVGISFSDTLNACFSVRLRDSVLHTHTHIHTHTPHTYTHTHTQNTRKPHTQTTHTHTHTHTHTNNTLDCGKVRAFDKTHRYFLSLCIHPACLSQWPCSLRRRSATARLLSLWVRIPPGDMDVCLLQLLCVVR